METQKIEAALEKKSKGEALSSPDSSSDSDAAWNKKKKTKKKKDSESDWTSNHESSGSDLIDYWEK